jgi:perosamine synthetase
MAVHIYGLPVDMDPLLEIAGRHGIPVIEDAAESHGLRYKDRIAGSMGLVSTFSFYANKNITTGEGGMVLTDDQLLAGRVRGLRNLAFQPERRFIHSELGWNARLSSLQCALGTSQLKRAPEILERRKAIGSLYNDAFSYFDGFSLPLGETAYAENNYWVYGLVLKPELEKTAREVMRSLELKGVGSRPFFFPLHLQPVLEKYGIQFGKHAQPESELLGEFGFYVPNGLGMSPIDAERVAQAVLEAVFEK